MIGSVVLAGLSGTCRTKPSGNLGEVIFKAKGIHYLNRCLKMNWVIIFFFFKCKDNLKNLAEIFTFNLLTC